MKKTWKKTLAALLSLSMVAGTVVLPAVTASAEAATFDASASSWKFDFGAGDAVADGYIGVSADRDYLATNDYGFLGLGDNGYKVSERTDSFKMKKGQKITLQNGAKAAVSGANDDWVGLTAAAEPIRFAMKAVNDKDYKVKAILTGADQSKAAEVSLYSEKRHPIVTEQTIAAGETLEVEFTATIQNVYYEKSEPNGTYNDDQLNVVVLGENAAIASLEVTEVQNAVTVWAYTDSTGCDQSAAFPYFKLQDCSGVAQSLSKYLSKDIAVSNQGEGGLTAADNLHWNTAKENIKAGDFVYVEFGHNHKSDGPEGYAAAIKKYYEKAHSVGAYTIFVSPCDRHNEYYDDANKVRHYLYDSTNNVWTSTLSGFGAAAEAYVNELIDGGANDVAYIDLNTPSLRWMEQVCADVKTKRGSDKYEANATDYYFQGTFGGGVDGTHPNDAGSDNLAYCVMQEAKKTVDADATSVQGKVLAKFIEGMRTDAAPYVVTQAIVDAGKAPNSAYPVPYVPDNLPALPNVIKDIQIAEGAVVSAEVLVREATLAMDSYGIVVITVTDENGAEKGKIYSTDQVDNSTGSGTQTITNFRTEPADLTIGDTDKYTAIVLKAKDTASGLVVDPDSDVAYSAVYEPTDIADYLIFDEDDNDGEDFEYTAATYEGDSPSDLGGNNGWNIWGSAGKTTTLGKDGDRYYANLINDGAKNGAANSGSFYVVKNLAETPVIGTTGKYMIQLDMKYISGGGLNVGLVHSASSGSPWGSDGLTFFTVGSTGIVTVGGTDTQAGSLSQNSWSTVKAILDMDKATLSVSVAGGASAEIPVSKYDTTELSITPEKYTQITFNANKNAAGVQISDLVVAKLKRDALPEYTATIATNDAAKGTVSIGGADSTGVALGYDKTTGKAAVKADKAMTVQLIEAKYTGKALTEIIPTTLTFTEAGTKTQDVTAGSKLMVWKTLDGVEPVVKAIDATETVALPADNAVTDAINTAITITATPAESNVFMGWYDNAELTGDPVSMDNPYTFRLRDDITLTAKFVKEPSIDDITDYSLVSDKANIKAVSGATFNVSIADAVDNASTPISVATNADAAWESTTAGVTVANGVVTIGENFAISAGETKPITIKATLNNIEKTCTVIAHLYDYYENFDGGDVTKMNWFTNLGVGKVEVKDGALAIQSQQNNNNTYSGTHFAAPEDVTDKLITIKLDYKTSSVGSGNATSGWFLTNLALTENSPTYAETYSGGKGVSFSNGTGGLGIAANTQYAVTIVINNKTKTAEVTATPAGGTAVTYSIADTKQPINTLYFRPGRNLTDTIDNLSVVIEDAPTE